MFTPDHPTVAKAQSIDQKEIIKPNMPIGIFCQEAFDTYYLAQEDKDALCGRGIDWTVVDDIPTRIDYLREQEARLNSLPYSETPLKKEYNELCETAKEAMGDLFKTLTYASCEDKEIVKAIRAIKRGKSKVDFIGDVFRAQALLDEQRAFLEKTNCYEDLQAKFAKCTPRIVVAQAELLVEYSDLDGSVDHRNRAYTHLFHGVDEIRRCARVALANNSKRLKGYASEYFRKKTKKRQSRKNS